MLEEHDLAVGLVRLFFQVVMQMLGHHRRHRIPASALLLQSAQAVAVRMGFLSVLLQDAMKIMSVTVPWDEHGPTIVMILDMKYESLFEAAFERMLQVERRVTSEMGVSSLIAQRIRGCERGE